MSGSSGTNEFDDYERIKMETGLCLTDEGLLNGAFNIITVRSASTEQYWPRLIAFSMYLYHAMWIDLICHELFAVHDFSVRDCNHEYVRSHGCVVRHLQR